MIFYFSGTSNSLQIAKDLAKLQSTSIISIADIINKNKNSYEFNLSNDEVIRFVLLTLKTKLVNPISCNPSKFYSTNNEMILR